MNPSFPYTSSLRLSFLCILFMSIKNQTVLKQNKNQISHPIKFQIDLWLLFFSEISLIQVYVVKVKN